MGYVANLAHGGQLSFMDNPTNPENGGWRGYMGGLTNPATVGQLGYEDYRLHGLQVAWVAELSPKWG